MRQLFTVDDPFGNPVRIGAILEMGGSRKRYRLDAVFENAVRVQRIGEDGTLKPKELRNIEVFGLMEMGIA